MDSEPANQCHVKPLAIHLTVVINDGRVQKFEQAVNGAIHEKELCDLLVKDTGEAVIPMVKLILMFSQKQRYLSKFYRHRSCLDILFLDTLSICPGTGWVNRIALRSLVTEWVDRGAVFSSYAAASDVVLRKIQRSPNHGNKHFTTMPISRELQVALARCTFQPRCLCLWGRSAEFGEVQEMPWLVLRREAVVQMLKRQQ